MRLVAGHATYNRNGKQYKGFHQWTETVIDGKGYYVDTFEPGQTRLIPMGEAQRSLSLKRSRMCGKNPNGTKVGPAKYDHDWMKEFLGDSIAALEAELDRLKALHKTLHEKCIAAEGAANVACTQRRAAYKKAIEIRKKIEKLKKEK